MNESSMVGVEPKEFQLRSGGSYVIRTGCPDDAADILSITNAVIREGSYVVTEPDEVQLDEEQERMWLRQQLEDPGHLVLVAESDSQVIGFLHFQNGSRRRVSHAGRFHMLLLEAWRGEGIGSQLIRTILDWTTANPDIEKVCFAVFSNNERALSLYRKFGFLEEGRRVRQIKLADGDYVDEILMYRWVSDKPPQADPTS